MVLPDKASSNRLSTSGAHGTVGVSPGAPGKLTFPTRFQRVTKRGEILDFGLGALGSNRQDWAGFLTVNWGAGENDL